MQSRLRAPCLWCVCDFVSASVSTNQHETATAVRIAIGGWLAGEQLRSPSCHLVCGWGRNASLHAELHDRDVHASRFSTLLCAGDCSRWCLNIKTVLHFISMSFLQWVHAFTFSLHCVLHLQISSLSHLSHTRQCVRCLLKPNVVVPTITCCCCCAPVLAMPRPACLPQDFFLCTTHLFCMLMHVHHRVMYTRPLCR